ncbi:MAG: chemotaxis-specific protein-glutamate methyltransferase CheB [Nitrospinae bacterium]|nr:chemotaxis-specific protein-glutamate methyltransferase CheB [Nitrospinota bacterium]
MIRVLITEDSPTIAEIIRMTLTKDKEIQVIGWAKNGKECIEMVNRLKPNVITMDIRMPIMDGFEATKEIMAKSPTPILVFSASINDDLNVAFNALKFGALDVLEKPRILTAGKSSDDMAEVLIQRIKVVSRVRPFKKIFKPTPLDYKKYRPKRISISADGDGILVIGASTGGPPVLNYILSKLHPKFPLPILVTQHISQGFMEGLITWLQDECPLKIKIGEDNETVERGSVYFAPDNYHMGITIDKKIFLNNTPPISGHRPSVDFLMESSASAYGEHCMGIILTGMGRDGAKGMMAIRNEGGFTLSQDEESSVIFGMPKVAIESGAVMKVCNIEQIPDEIIYWIQNKNIISHRDTEAQRNKIS